MKAEFKGDRIEDSRLIVTIETEEEREAMAKWKEYMEDCTVHPYIDCDDEGMEYKFYV